MQDIIRFHVPCSSGYVRLVEQFTEILSTYLYPTSDENFKQKLRAVMNEVFVNIVNHTQTANENEVVRFQFEIGLQYFSISIYDYGPGFGADSHFPPYPKECIGKKYKLREVIDGAVYYKVIDPFSISFTFEEKEDIELDDLLQVEEIREDGLGMSIVTKLMDGVTYSYVGNGKFDWRLTKNIS